MLLAARCFAEVGRELLRYFVWHHTRGSFANIQVDSVVIGMVLIRGDTYVVVCLLYRNDERLRRKREVRCGDRNVRKRLTTTIDIGIRIQVVCSRGIAGNDTRIC